MNEEYLWSKKGSDPDIQQLEKMLAGYRFSPEPPELAVMNIVQFEPRKQPRFAWIFAAAAPALATLAIVFWLGFSNQGEVAVRIPDETPVEKATHSRDAEIARFKTPDGLNETLGKPVRAIEGRPRTLNRKSRLATRELLVTQKAKLTREEKYAYDQLMLALSIAGTKLKTVQDTIDRKNEVGQRNYSNQK